MFDFLKMNFFSLKKRFFCFLLALYLVLQNNRYLLHVSLFYRGGRSFYSVLPCRDPLTSASHLARLLVSITVPAIFRLFQIQVWALLVVPILHNDAL